MANLRQVHQRSLAGFQFAFQEAGMEYQRAAMADDLDGMAAAAQQMAGLRASMDALNNMAHEAYVSELPAPDANRYGLSPDEVKIAHGIAGSDPNLDNDARERVYAEQKSKLAHMRASGTYRDQFR